MKRVSAQHVYAHDKKNNILHAQHGLYKGRSTTTNLLESLNDWTLATRDKYS